MKIALTGKTMTYLSGQPLYVYEVAREMKRLGLDVSVVSVWANNELKQNLIKIGVPCMTDSIEEYDVAFISEMDYGIQTKKKIQIVHSEYDCETPIEGMDGYVCIRPEIQEHIIREHTIPREKTIVIYNGVDMERFKPIQKQERNYTKVVVPCTLDKLRERFLQEISKSREDRRVFLIGDNYGANIPLRPFTFFHPSTFNIERFIADADEVHGIHLGRVNLEAYACGVDSYIWNPVTLEKEKYKPKDFEKNHNIVNVVQQLLEYTKTI